MLRDLTIRLEKYICECHIETGKCDYGWNMICDEKTTLELVVYCKQCRKVANISNTFVKARIIVQPTATTENIKDTVNQVRKRLDVIDKAVTKSKKKFDKPN